MAGLSSYRSATFFFTASTRSSLNCIRVFSDGGAQYERGGFFGFPGHGCTTPSVTLPGRACCSVDRIESISVSAPSGFCLRIWRFQSSVID
jgi:hypothetical protein